MCWCPGAAVNLPQTRWVRTTEGCALTALEARRPRSRHRRGCAPSGGPGRIPPAPSSFWGCWPSLAWSCVTPACACLHLAPFCVSSLPPLTHRAPKLESGAPSIQGDSLSRPLTSLHLQKPYLPKVTVTGSRGTYPWRPPFHPPHLVRHPGQTRAGPSTCQAAGSRVGPPHS